MKSKINAFNAYVEMGVPSPFDMDDAVKIKYDSSIFPGGEVFIRHGQGFPKSNVCVILICASIMSSDDLMKVLNMTDALRRSGASDVVLYVPYVPYARQDRVCNPGEAFSLKVLADLINAQNYFEVIVFDPHSDVIRQGEAAINNLTVMDNHDFVLAAIPFDKFVLVSPDRGALRKVTRLAKFLRDNDTGMIDPVVEAEKIRDPVTTQIISTVVRCDDLNGADVVIVDDICDGGRTFIELAKVLKEEKNAGRIALVVSHGIFSQGISNLVGYIDYVVCSDSVYVKKYHWDDLDAQIKYRCIPLRDTFDVDVNGK